MLDTSGPLLIASNHPNSFLDAIILATLFKKPIYSLARGDAFAGKLITKILVSLHMLPVYRLSEGLENIENNYSTFDACHNIFLEGGIVLIFSEGSCVNEWHLRPLRKGTARLAITAWKQNIPLRVLPLGINYNGFRNFGKIIKLNFGSFISKDDMSTDVPSGRAVNEFNDKLKEQLKSLVYEIDPDDYKKQKDYFQIHSSSLKQIILFVPAAVGFVLHAPLYYSIHYFIKNRAQDHYDSILTGLLFFVYPFYISFLTLMAFFFTHNPLSFLLLLFLPFTVFILLRYKEV